MPTKPDLRYRMPLRDDVQSVTYHRPPTEAEIKFGEGATHYIELLRDECTFEGWNGQRFLKKWLVHDSLRYYR